MPKSIQPLPSMPKQFRITMKYKNSRKPKPQKTAAPLASISQETPSSHLINPAQIVAEPAIAALRFKSHAMTILLCQGMTSVMPQQHQNQHGFSR